MCDMQQCGVLLEGLLTAELVMVEWGAASALWSLGHRHRASHLLVLASSAAGSTAGFACTGSALCAHARGSKAAPKAPPPCF
jgi:hypothetical protein